MYVEKVYILSKYSEIILMSIQLQLGIHTHRHTIVIDRSVTKRIFNPSFPLNCSSDINL